MSKMLNGIEVPTKGRIVWVRVGKHGDEYPAIAIDGVDLAPDLFFMSKSNFGVALTVMHESSSGLIDGYPRWRWPPREEQPAAVVTAPTEAAPSLEERVRQLEARIDEEPTANDKQKERLQRQLERKTIEARANDETQAKREAIIAKLQEERDSALLRLTNALYERDAARTLVEETKQQFAAETHRATVQAEESNRLQGLLNEIERVFGNALIYNAAEGDLVEKARIAHKGGAEGARALGELAELRRKHTLACNYVSEVQTRVDGLLANVSHVLFTGRTGG